MTVDKSLLAGSTTMLVLKLLDGQDMYGYQMIEELSRRSERAFALKTGTLYPLLHSLEEKELIRSYEKDEGAARPRPPRAATTIWSARGNICCAKKKSNGQHLPLRSIAC